MTASELRELADDELATELAEHKEELFNLRFQIVTGQLDDPRRIRAVKTQIARCLTVMREREIAAERAAETQTPASSAASPAPSATSPEE